VRPPGGPRTFAELNPDATAPDPMGGPIAIGAVVTYSDWRGTTTGRVARRLGDRYAVFANTPGKVTEVWLTPDNLKVPGAAAPLAPARAYHQPTPQTIAEIRAGDMVEARPRNFWGQYTVLAVDGARYYVKLGPDTGLSQRGWVGLWQMRPVGGKELFQPEDLNFFVGAWRLSGDSFQNLVDRRVSGSSVTETYQNNSEAGQKAGSLVIKVDGTYELKKTVVYHDGRGHWERNPNLNEGGIILLGADGKDGNLDAIVTNHHDGFAYFQGSFRGPGKWCTREGK
jgi:hypothetical protein